MALGSWLVIGRNRSPIPAAKIIAFIEGPILKAAIRRSSEFVEVVGEERNETLRGRQSRHIAFQTMQGSGNELHITGLAFDDIEVVEAADDLQIALNRGKQIDLPKVIARNHRAADLATSREKVLDQLRFQRRRDHAISD